MVLRTFRSSLIDKTVTIQSALASKSIKSKSKSKLPATANYPKQDTSTPALSQNLRMEDPNSYKIEELIKSFSASVISLAEDSETTFGLAAVVSATATTKNDCSVLDQLQSLEEMVSDLEAQMSMMQEAVREEQVAVQELERTKALTEEQSSIIEKMLHATPGTGVNSIGSGTRAGDTVRYVSSSSATVVTASTGTLSTTDKNYNDGKASEIIRGGGGSSSAEEYKVKKQLLAQQLQLDLVTETELNSVCKNIRGRIPLAWVNDALTDIVKVGRRKYEVMLKYDKTGLAKLTLGNDYKRRMSLSRKHQSYLNRHYDIEVKELQGKFWVSEQDLRDSCGFFAKESSARAILLILRSLKRLKQVYGRRSMVTYILLTSESDD